MVESNGGIKKGDRVWQLGFGETIMLLTQNNGSGHSFYEKNGRIPMSAGKH
jgi:hypothetical protein